MARKRGWGCFSVVIVLLVAIGLYYGVSALVRTIQWSTADTNDLVERLGSSDQDTRDKARARLVEEGNAAVPALAAATKNGTTQQRAGAAATLARIGTPAAVDALVPVLADANQSVAAVAEAAIAKVGVAALPVLKTALAEGDESLRAGAAYAMGAIGSAKAAGALKAALADDSALVRVAAAEAAGLVKADIAGARLVALFDDKDAGVRKAAAAAVVRLHRAAVARPLRRALKSARARTRLAAVRAVATLHIGAAAPRLVRMLHDGNFDVRDAARTALIALGKPAVAPLEDQTGRAAGEFKWEAADILAEIAAKDPAAVKSLVAYLRRGDAKGVADHYAFFIRLGRKGSENMLDQALYSYGDPDMCVDYLNCGNDKLDAAGRKWATSHGYQVTSQTGSYGGPVWGEGE
jgi:HEAT repeat protein